MKLFLVPRPVSLLETFHCHQSILKTQEAFNTLDTFSFHEVSEDEVRQEILRLDGTKSTPVGDIPAEMLESIIDINASILTETINLSLRNGCFSDYLKAAEDSPIFEKIVLQKENYKPGSVLPHMLKVFVRIMHTQLESSMEGKLSNILQKWKITLDKGRFVCAMFMDLSKAFDTVNHNLLIPKLGAYGFQKDALSFLKSYLTKRRARVPVNSNFSAWERIISRVSQGSILGPLLFKIFLNDLFFFVKNSDLSNYADDNTIYCCGNNLEEVKKL